MVSINVKDFQNSICKLNRIKPFNEEMTFYYDESGNCRKFYLNENGFNDGNAIKGDFVLAGVAHKGETFSIDLEKLYESLEYKEGQKELKFKHLFHNSTDFLRFIGSKRAIKFLEWLSNSGLYIHYSALNNLFYSLVDIVDSLWETHPECIIFIWEIKNALYDFVIEHQDEVVKILIKYEYPDIKDSKGFSKDLCELIQVYNNNDEFGSGFHLEMFRQMLKTAGKYEKLEFIQNNEPFMLIDEYYQLYLERCELFSKSKHVFDEEPEIQLKLKNVELVENENSFINWMFVKSHENIFVQISDLIAGLLRKLFMFLDSNSIEKTKSIAKELNCEQKNNFSIILSLILKSNELTPLLIKNSNTPKNIDERMIKLQILGMK